MTERGFSSTWAWIGCGCGAILLIAMSVLGAVVFLGWRAARDLEAGFEDPERRQAAVEEVLHPRSMPSGLKPVGGLHLPWLLDLAILSDRLPEQDENEEIGERVFVFIEVAAFLYGGESEWEDDLGFLDSGNIRVGRDELIGRGEIAFDDMDVRYAAFRGDVDVDGRQRDGLVNLLYFSCHEPPDTRHRFGIWVTPDPAPRRPVAELELSGTPADEEAVRALLGHFAPCA